MNKPSFSNWNQIITLIENFFVTTEFQANIIKNLKKITKQLRTTSQNSVLKRT